MPIANVFQPLIDVAESILRFFHDQAGFGWGLSIIALTVVVRLAILPLTFKQVRSMQALQRLQPEIKKIQERHKGDKQKMNQEMMRFYQEHKVNPLGSCLPIVLQLPFFLSLYYMLRKDLKADICPEKVADLSNKALQKAHCATDSSSFLFIHDLTDKAKPTSVLIVLIVLYVGTQLASSLVTAISMDRNQRLLMLALPFVFVTFIVSFPTGLIVYWITTNLWTVGQQLLVRKLYPKPEPIGTTAAAAGGSGGNGRGAAPAKPPPPAPRKRGRARR